jgi:hypothetical protein
MPEEICALWPAAPETRAEDDVGDAALERFDQLRDVGGSTITSCFSNSSASTRPISSAIVEPSLNAGMMKLTFGTVAEGIASAR